MSNEKRGSFSGSIGFVLAAAGSAVGLGNLWRFPYLAAKNGGGVFLLVYIVLALTFGFALMTTEIAIGRKTRRSPIKAYGDLKKGFGFLGYFSSIVPFIIFPYYCVIGGWVTKYTIDYLDGRGWELVSDSYFGGFITSPWSPIFWCAVFMIVCAVVVFAGVDKGIEKFSKILMPVLIVLIVAVAIFALTIKGNDGRTAMDGLKIYLVPDFTGMTFSRFIGIVVDAMSQIFYSMSLAMGIMITYGSYMRKEDNMVKSVNHIEIFDTAIAFLAGLIMIPVVYAFQGHAGLEASGPSLLFVALPKVFAQMGWIGDVVAAAFFILVVFAALTSAVSLLEAITSVVMDKFGWERKKSCWVVLLISGAIALFTCLGYSKLTMINLKIETLSINLESVLDILDYTANNILMPIVALITCILVGWVIKPKAIIDEVQANGEKFGRKGLYNVMVKFVAPVCLIVIFLQAFGLVDKFLALF
ncbi:MAG: sodium-dependent transporter [Clostridia bacterium]|nr:sodium-dependent transporter [Clostridia bacterium]